MKVMDMTYHGNTNFRIGLLALTAAIISVSCARDLGNYSYRELDEPVVGGIAESYETLTMDNLNIIVSIEGGAGEDSYDYEWKVIDRNNDNEETVIGTERDLSYTVVLSPGAYSLYYTLTEKESGLMWQTTSSLTVSSSMSEGWMVLCSDNGEARLDFISEVTGRTYTDILGSGMENGMPRYMGPRKIQWLSTNADESSPYYLLTDDGATRLGKDSFEWKEEYSLVYESGAGTDLRPHSIVSSGIGKMLVSGTDAHYCEMLGFSGLYGSAINDGFEAAPQIGANVLATQIYAAVYLLYDMTGKKFMAYCPLLDDIGGYGTLQEMDAMGQIAEEQTAGKEGSDGVVETVAFEYPEGYDYVYMENTGYDPGNAYMGVTYTILADGDRRYVYGIQCGDMLTYADCTFVLGKAAYCDISGCTDITGGDNLYAFSSLRSYMYHASGGRIYRTDLSKSPAVSELQIELPGETVTCLKFNLYRNSGNSRKSYDLIIGSETADGKGILRIYEGYDSVGDFSGKEPVETYDGFATIVDVSYKERTY